MATGFGLAALVGIPLGVLAGCFRGVGAFFAPLLIVGRNVPVAALIPLTFSLFGIDEFQKVMFIFIACVAFVMSDSARAVNDISDRYIDTAYTLGAGRRQVILKVLFPLALPGIFNSLRMLFGLAFGYIMLAEVVEVGGSAGLGGIIYLGPAPRAPDLYPVGADDYSPGGPGHRPDALLDPAGTVPLPLRRQRHPARSGAASLVPWGRRRVAGLPAEALRAAHLEDPDLSHEPTHLRESPAAGCRCPPAMPRTSAWARYWTRRPRPRSASCRG